VVSLAGILICMSVVVVTGFVGQISLAQVAFAGIGGLITARLSNSLPFPIVLLASGTVALLVGLLVGLPSLRVRGPSLALVTLSAAFVCQIAIFADDRLLGSSGYNRVATPSLFGAGLSERAFGVVVLVIVVAAGAGVQALRLSAFGRRAMAVRENESAAVAAGINLKQYKLAAFGLSAFMAGVGGSLLGYQAHVFAFEQFGVFESLNVIVLASIGGIGMVSGAVMAGLGASGGLFSQLLAVSGIDAYHEIIAGGLLLIAVQLHPDGIVSTKHTIQQRLRRKGSKPGRPPTESPIKSQPPMPDSGIKIKEHSA